MAYTLLIDSGSTKADWCLIDALGNQQSCQTIGLNPYQHTELSFQKVLTEEVNLKLDPLIPLHIYFYGAGINSPAISHWVHELLHARFNAPHIEVHSDLLAAAHATCGLEKGVVCILGTGSNSGYYNGTKIEHSNPSLGYIVGDEGSGAFLGKKVLQYYFYNTFDEDLKAAFELKYGNNLKEILHHIYKEPFANRYLAKFSIFLQENKNHFMAQNIVEDAFIDFHQRHILKYRQSWKYPIHFVGSVAYEFRDVIYDLHQQYGLETGNFLKSPMKGLIDFYSKKAQMDQKTSLN